MILSLIFSLFLVTIGHAASVEDWHKVSVYQLVTDRFATSNDSSLDCDSSKRQYCGGTWKGVMNHLDYIQDMGFDAIWISPIVANIEGETPYGQAYHGYWTRDINTLNSNFGTPEDLKNLSTALHTRGMYLMVDVIVNHFAIVPERITKSGFINLDYDLLAPFSALTDFHRQCFVVDYTNQTEVEQCWLGDRDIPLPDLDTENSTVVDTMNTWIKGMVTEYGVDGLRLDTVKHVRKTFWPEFSKSAGVFTLGEVLSDNVTYTSDYTDVIDSVFDYPTWFILTAAFSSPQGNLSALEDVMTRTQNTYKKGAFKTGSFLENHDKPRFQSLTQDQALVKNAMVWPFVHDGIPIVYYGQEQGYQGAADPSNREALWFSGYETDKPLVSHIKALNAGRKLAIATNENFLTTPMHFIPQANNATMAITKPPLLALLTNVGNTNTPAVEWKVPGSMQLFRANETVVDILTCKSFEADSEGGLTMQGDYGSPKYMVPASLLNPKGVLCPSEATLDYSGTMRSRNLHWIPVGGAIIVGALARVFV